MRVILSTNNRGQAGYAREAKLAAALETDTIGATQVVLMHLPVSMVRNNCLVVTQQELGQLQELLAEAKRVC